MERRTSRQIGLKAAVRAKGVVELSGGLVGGLERTRWATSGSQPSDRRSTGQGANSLRHSEACNESGDRRGWIRSVEGVVEGDMGNSVRSGGRSGRRFTCEWTVGRQVNWFATLVPSVCIGGCSQTTQHDFGSCRSSDH